MSSHCRVFRNSSAEACGGSTIRTVLEHHYSIQPKRHIRICIRTVFCNGITTENRRCRMMTRGLIAVSRRTILFTSWKQVRPKKGTLKLLLLLLTPRQMGIKYRFIYLLLSIHISVRNAVVPGPEPVGAGRRGRAGRGGTPEASSRRKHK